MLLYLNESPTETNLTFNQITKFIHQLILYKRRWILRMTFSSEYLPINHKMHVYGIYVYDENDQTKGEEFTKFYTLSYIPKLM